MVVRSKLGDSRFLKDPTVVKIRGFIEDNISPFFRVIEEHPTATTIKCKGQRMVMLGSNNYLGLTHHPYVQEKAIQSIGKYGTGCTGSRFLTGNFELHEELEYRLAKFLGFENDVIIFATGMQANLGALSSLLGYRDCSFTDSENHASIIDGLRFTKNVFKFNHNNFEELKSLLEREHGNHDRLIIVTDGVFSMSGEIANLLKLKELALKYDAKLYVDDAHGIGVLGARGRGTCSELNVRPDFLMGTFSKSFASIGGFLTGSIDALEYVRLHARSLIFSAALPPSAVATVLACLDLIEEDRDETLIKQLRSNVSFMEKELKILGYEVVDYGTGILKIDVGDDKKAMDMTHSLEKMGVFVTPAIQPAVPKAIIRTSYSAAHTKSELEYCLDKFNELKRVYGN